MVFLSIAIGTDYIYYASIFHMLLHRCGPTGLKSTSKQKSKSLKLANFIFARFRDSANEVR